MSGAAPNPLARFRPYRVEYQGIVAVCWAESAGKARYRAALAAKDGGWMRTADPSAIKARREPACDHLAAFEPYLCYGYGYLPAQ